MRGSRTKGMIEYQHTGALGLITTLGLRLLGLDGVPGPPAEV